MAKKGKLKGTKKDKEVKIVVVDDSEFSRKTIVNILEADNYNVVGEAGSAEKAIQIAHTTNANLFIIDVVMPDISGLDLAKHLQEKQEDTEIIMMSSLDSESIILESISHGAVDFLKKPFEKDDLLKSVSRLTKKIQEGDL